MPTESIVFSPEISERDLDREVAGVNDQLEDAASGVGADFDADMDALTPPGGGGGGGLAATGGTSLLALAESRNDILVDIRESLGEDFVGDDGGGGGGMGVIGAGSIVTALASVIPSAGAIGVGVAAALAGKAGLEFLPDKFLVGWQGMIEAAEMIDRSISQLQNFKWPSVSGLFDDIAVGWDVMIRGAEMLDSAISGLMAFQWPAAPSWMNPFTSWEWPATPEWINPFTDWSFPQPPRWLTRFINLASGGGPGGGGGGGPSRQWQLDHNVVPSNVSDASGGGGSNPINIDVDAPIDVNPDQIVRDIQRELEPIVRREIQDLRDEITQGGPIF